jgi:hypothetical protein
MRRRTSFAAELPWPDYQTAVAGGAAILIPIGSMEQHGHHMPLHVDVLLSTEFARRAAEAIGGLVAPPFAYGYKSHQKSGGGNHLPGTTSLDGAASREGALPRGNRSPVCCGRLGHGNQAGYPAAAGLRSVRSGGRSGNRCDL